MDVLVPIHGLRGLPLPLDSLGTPLKGLRPCGQVWEGGACPGGVWAGATKPLGQRLSGILGLDAQMCPPMDLSPEGHPGPGIIQALQCAQVVGQRVFGIAGQDSKDHRGQRWLCDTRSLEPGSQQKQQR